MEYVNGDSLRTEIDKGISDIDEILNITNQICEGLSEAHKADIVHRDIKPENILIDSRGRVKILDFGLAKLKGVSKLTKETSTLGTIHYMSPEQIQGQEVDHRSDIWSLGVVLYEMLTGEAPFKGDYEQAVTYAILNEEPKSTAFSDRAVSSHLENIIFKALEKKADDRNQNIEELLSDLEQIQKSTDKDISSRVQLNFKSFLKKKVIIIPIIAILLTAITFSIFHYITSKSSRTSSIKRLVVLPFKNLGSSEDEYFADGLTEEITARLANIRGILVISRTSAMQYNKENINDKDIGSDLGADYLLAGTVRWQHSSDGTSKIRVTPKLIRVSDGTHVWTDIYDEVLSEIFKVQSNIAKNVVKALDITLFDSEQMALDSRPTKNIDAYDYYLRGTNFQRRSYTKEDYIAAISMFEYAIKLDSSFALAYAQLADIHTEMFWFEHDRSKERLLKAENAIKKALELEPESPQVQFVEGRFYYHSKRDYDRALDIFFRVQEVLPNESKIFMSIGAIQRRMGKFEEALKNIKKALEYDPNSAVYTFEIAMTYYDMHKYLESERFFDKAISLAPTWPTAYHLKAHLYLSWYGSKEKAQHVYEDALERVTPSDFVSKSQANLERTLWKIIDIKHLKDLKKISQNHFQSNIEIYYLFKAELYERLEEKDRARAYYDSARIVYENKIKLFYDDYLQHSQVGIAYAGLGMKEKSILEGKEAVDLLPLSKDAKNNPLLRKWLAQIYTMVGEKDAAIDELKDLLLLKKSRTTVTLPWLRIDPTWDPLRDHPRFIKLLKEGN